jgi:hypothetical protein
MKADRLCIVVYLDCVQGAMEQHPIHILFTYVSAVPKFKMEAVAVAVVCLENVATNLQ